MTFFHVYFAFILLEISVFVSGEEEESSVTMELDEDMITAAIETKNDTYHLEPSSGHIDGDTKKKMIAYRDSDVIWNVTFAG
ncbi:Hypothetical predicted protein, partial [Paramuricea clavata]